MKFKLHDLVSIVGGPYKGKTGVVLSISAGRMPYGIEIDGGLCSHREDELARRDAITQYDLIQAWLIGLAAGRDGATEDENPYVRDDA